MIAEKEGIDEPIGQAIHKRAQGAHHRPGSRVLRRYLSTMRLAGVSDPRESPAGVQPIETVTRFSRRCERVTYDWLADDIGWQPTPDQQGALLRHRAERAPLACVVQHVHGGLTGWYFRPKIPPKLVEWLCPAELRLRTQKECQSEPGDEVIWMVRE